MAFLNYISPIKRLLDHVLLTDLRQRTYGPTFIAYIIEAIIKHKGHAFNCNFSKLNGVLLLRTPLQTHKKLLPAVLRTSRYLTAICGTRFYLDVVHLLLYLRPQRQFLRISLRVDIFR